MKLYKDCMMLVLTHLRGRLNVELYNNEREIRGLDNVLDPKVGLRYRRTYFPMWILMKRRNDNTFPHQTSQLINFSER
jgi:hypothetical protein